MIWSTGFRPDYRWVHVPGFLGGDGWPTGSRGTVASAPGLYFLGVPFTYGFTSMLVAGAGRDAGYVADRIVDAVRGTAPGSLEPAYAGRSRSAGPM